MDNMEAPLGTVATIIMGTSPKGATYNNDYNGLPLLNGPTEFGQIHPSCTLFTTDSKRDCKKNDLIFCVRGSTTGRMNWADKAYSLGRGVCAIRGATEKDTRFIRYCIELKLSTLLSSCGGSTFPNLTGNDLASFRIPYPSYREKVVAILSAYDDLIENNTRRIKILEEMAQTLYREWFVNFRFPGHEKVQMVDSPLGEIPEGWVVNKLGRIAEINAASIKNSSSPEEIYYIDISSVSTGQIDKIERISFSEAPSRARRIVRHGDMIWSAVRPNRRSYSLILNPPLDLIVSTGFAVISAKYAPYTYLYHALTTEDFVSYLTNHATGAAYPAVNAHDFEDANILFPPNECLESFHIITKNFFDQRQNLQQKNTNLHRTRDLLLPKLITGEMDVDTLDIKTEGMTQ